VDPSGVYRTEQGKIWRILKSDEGALRVEVLEQGEWVQGRIGMVGLRLSRETTRLTAAAIRKLPA
jgi:hypothetical protein